MTQALTQAGPTAAYFAHLEAGRFMIQRSASTGEWVFYPRMMAPRTGATDLEWAAPSGRGVVYSTTTARKRPPESDVNLAVIELEEGPRLMSRVEGIPAADVKIGMTVLARIVDGIDGKIVVFVPEEVA